MIILPKGSADGIKCDTAAPTFAWHDLFGDIAIRGVGGTDPTFAVYRGNLRGFQFTVNDEVWNSFHVPHDYAPGTDIYIHAHWSHISTTVTSGSATWGFDVSYAKGHDQAAFSATVNPTVAQAASTTQYQHMIAEVQLSAASPSATQIDTDNIEVDGLIMVRTYLSANTINGTPKPFLHFVDIHYQSRDVGTKQKSPPFYT